MLSNNTPYGYEMDEACRTLSVGLNHVAYKYGISPRQLARHYFGGWLREQGIEETAKRTDKKKKLSQLISYYATIKK